MTRAEHLEWCKVRAREYIALGDYGQAVTSMLSDLGKHDETKALCNLGPLGMFELTRPGGPTRKGVSDFIEGFN